MGFVQCACSRHDTADTGVLQRAGMLFWRPMFGDRWPALRLSVVLSIGHTGRFAVVTDRYTTTSASSGCTLVATRRTWSRRPLATAEVGSLNVRRTGRLIFCITKPRATAENILGRYNWIQPSSNTDSIVSSMNISFPPLVDVAWNK